MVHNFCDFIINAQISSVTLPQPHKPSIAVAKKRRRSTTKSAPSRFCHLTRNTLGGAVRLLDYVTHENNVNYAGGCSILTYLKRRPESIIKVYFKTLLKP